MSGDLRVDLSRLAPLRRRLERLSHLRVQELLDVLGSEVESQTRRRLSEEKTSPAGEAWDEWSEDYAARRPNKGGLLELSGDLLDSITYEVSSDAVTVGSNLIYAGTHQDGRENAGGGMDIPARPYLGISDQNGEDLVELTIAFLAREFGA